MRVYIQIAMTVLSATCYGASSWLEIAQSGYVLRTDAGERTARRIVTKLEQIDRAFAVRGSIPQESGPVQIYVFDSQKEFAGFRSKSWETGLTFTFGKQAPVILLYQGENMERVLGHEYAHSVVSRWQWKLPDWFEEGLADLCGTAEISDRKITLGAAIPQNLALLQERGLYEGTAVPAEHPELFYATSWAMVHMLHFDKRYKEGLGGFLQAVLNGDEAEDAFQRSFGRTLRAAREDLRSYIRNTNWTSQTYETSEPVGTPAAAEIKAMSHADSQFLLADLALDLGRQNTASMLLRQIAADYPKTADGEEALAREALAEGNTKSGYAHLQAAARLGSTRARVWSDLAELDRQAGVSWREHLERAAALEPGDFQANFMLGVRAADDGDKRSALKYLAKAAAAAPGRADVWHAYALALIESQKPEEARVAIRRGLKAATSVEQEKMMGQLLALADPAKAQRVNSKPAVAVSPAWQSPVPEAYVEGRFVNLECTGAKPAMTIDSNGKLLIFKIDDPRSVELRNTGSGEASIQFQCGKQDGRRVRIGTIGKGNTVLSVEFLQVQAFPQF